MKHVKSGADKHISNRMRPFRGM